jgi:undecaprenyl phosphate N,N'-diacetylbacillosamine 1-phosphate transferase
LYLKILKRVFELLLLAVILPIILPLTLLIITLNIITEGGEVFFNGTRVGLNLHYFRIYKFRTMKPGSHKKGYSTDVNDVRITKLGKLLRKTSLDEIPQFLNLAIGNMSLIGPRPDDPRMKVLYRQDQWEERHRVKPGITGLSQALGRNNLSMKQRIRLDLFYVNKISFKLDIYILYKTFITLIRQKSF